MWMYTHVAHKTCTSLDIAITSKEAYYNVKEACYNVKEAYYNYDIATTCAYDDEASRPTSGFRYEP